MCGANFEVFVLHKREQGALSTVKVTACGIKSGIEEPQRDTFLVRAGNQAVVLHA